jgi:predicted nucleotide-binding protein (sugar kinase/HSP70/actin superfamily)
MARKFPYMNLMLPSMLLCAVAAFAQEDVRKVKLTPPQQKVIDEKCLVCHNKKRIEAAIQERKDMEKILRRMEVKGVVLTDTERRVMGHFWPQQPLKGK